MEEEGEKKKRKSIGDDKGCLSTKNHSSKENSAEVYTGIDSAALQKALRSKGHLFC